MACFKTAGWIGAHETPRVGILEITKVLWFCSVRRAEVEASKPLVLMKPGNGPTIHPYCSGSWLQ